MTIGSRRKYRLTLLGALVVGFGLLLGFALKATPGTASQNESSAAHGPSSVPDLSGYWEIKDPFGRGLRGGALVGHPDPPVLTPQAQAMADAQRARQQAGQVVSDTSQYCKTLAYPFFMTSSPPFNIVQGPDAILVLAEREMGSRHIYMDGRGHPDPAHLEPTDNGDAVGRWEGDTLVVDTIGFKGGAGAAGGYTSPRAHLVERYRLIDGGSRLSVTFTWDDPEVYLKPYTYELAYFRSARGMYAMEDWCDASDPLQTANDLSLPKK